VLSTRVPTKVSVCPSVPKHSGAPDVLKGKYQASNGSNHVLITSLDNGGQQQQQRQPDRRAFGTNFINGFNNINNNNNTNISQQQSQQQQKLSNISKNNNNNNLKQANTVGNENIESDNNFGLIGGRQLDFELGGGIGEPNSILWQATLLQQTLYLHVPSQILLHASKEAFVKLLEYAEEQLNCQTVVISIDRNRIEKNNSLMRMFMYFGFTMLPAAHRLAPRDMSDSKIYMAYTIQ
jgi:ornithine decarboxylase antizyme 1